MFHGFGADHNVLVIRGKTKNGLFRECRFWAERGLLHCEDSLDNSYNSMSVRQFLHRVKALNDMLANDAVNSDAGADAALREEVTRNVEMATEIARQAQEQGMPSDASARRDLVRRRKTTVYMCGNGVL